MQEIIIDRIIVDGEECLIKNYRDVEFNASFYIPVKLGDKQLYVPAHKYQKYWCSVDWHKMPYLLKERKVELLKELSKKSLLISDCSSTVVFGSDDECKSYSAKNEAKFKNDEADEVYLVMHNLQDNNMARTFAMLNTLEEAVVSLNSERLKFENYPIKNLKALKKYMKELQTTTNNTLKECVKVARSSKKVKNTKEFRTVSPKEES